MKQFRIIFFVVLLIACQRPETPTVKATESAAAVSLTGTPTHIVPTATIDPVISVPSVEPTVESNPEMPTVVDQDYLFQARFPAVSADGLSGAFWQKSEHAERWYLAYWHDGDILGRQVTNLMAHEDIVQLDSLVMNPDGTEVAYLVRTDLSHSPNLIVVVYNINDGSKRTYMPTNEDYFRQDLRYTEAGQLTWISLNQKQHHNKHTDIIVWDTLSDDAEILNLPEHGVIDSYQMHGTSWAYSSWSPEFVVYHSDGVDYPYPVRSYKIAMDPAGIGVAYSSDTGVYLYSAEPLLVSDRGYLLAWSSDGESLVYTVWDDGVYLFSLDGATTLKLSNASAVFDLAVASNAVLADTGTGIEVYFLEP